MKIKFSCLLPIILFISCISNNQNSEDVSTQGSSPEEWNQTYGANDKLGYVDQNGNVMIDYQFDLAHNFKNGLAEVAFEGILGDRFLINPEGEVVSEAFISLRENGKNIPFIAKTNEDSLNFFLINDKGKTISVRFESIEYVEEQNVFIVEQTCDSCGTEKTNSALMDLKGIIISDWYQKFDPFIKGDFLVVSKGSFSNQLEAAINNKGELISDWYRSIHKMNDLPGYYQCNSGDSWNNKGIMNQKGEVVLEPAYYRIEPIASHNVLICTIKDDFDEHFDLLSENFIKVGKSDLPIYIASSGRLIGVSSSKSKYAYYEMKDDTLKKVTPDYQMESKTISGIRERFFIFKARKYTKNIYWIPEFSEDLARVRKNGNYGFIDTTGKLVIDYKYSLAADFENGKCGIEINGETFQINKQGEIVSE